MPSPPDNVGECIVFGLSVYAVFVRPRAVYVLLAIIFLSFKNKPLSKKNLQSTGWIFTKFAPYGRHLIIDCRFDPLFTMTQQTLPWRPILGSKLAKSCYSPSFVALAGWQAGWTENAGVDIDGVLFCDLPTRTSMYRTECNDYFI